jgi:hypothetical protein
MILSKYLRLLPIIMIISLINVSDFTRNVEAAHSSLSISTFYIEELGSEEATFVGFDKSPYNLSVILSKYETPFHTYWTTAGTDQVIMIEPKSLGNYTTEPIFKESELEGKARDFISRVASKVFLDELVPSFGNKEGKTFFFRWIDESRKLPIGESSFIQVGYSIK